MQAQSVGLKAQFSHEEGSNRELCECIKQLEADLNDEAKRAVTNEDEVDCLQTELADAGAAAQNPLYILVVGTQCLIVCQHVKDKGFSTPLSCLLVCKALYE